VLGLRIWTIFFEVLTISGAPTRSSQIVQVCASVELVESVVGAVVRKDCVEAGVDVGLGQSWRNFSFVINHNRGDVGNAVRRNLVIGGRRDADAFAGTRVGGASDGLEKSTPRRVNRGDGIKRIAGE
jgi:hypothetical protein